MNNKLRHLLVLVAAAAMMPFFNNVASAQDEASREERRQRTIDGYKERLEVKSEEDWKNKISPLVGKVVDAQREARSGVFGGFGGGRGGNAGGGDQGGNRNRGGNTPNPDRDALQKAVEDKAPADEVKEKLAKYREGRKAKEFALEKAQDDLRKVLSPRQEAGAVLVGLLR